MRCLFAFLAAPLVTLSCRAPNSLPEAGATERRAFSEFLESAERALGVRATMDEVELVFPRTRADLEVGPSPEGHQPWTQDRETVLDVDLEPYFGPSRGEWNMAGEAPFRGGSISRLTMIRGSEDHGILVSALLYRNAQGRCFTLKAAWGH